MHPQKRYTRYIALAIPNPQPAETSDLMLAPPAVRSHLRRNTPDCSWASRKSKRLFDAQHVPDLFFFLLACSQSMIQSPDAGESGGESETTQRSSTLSFDDDESHAHRSSTRRFSPAPSSSPLLCSLHTRSVFAESHARVAGNIWGHTRGRKLPESTSFNRDILSHLLCCFAIDLFIVLPTLALLVMYSANQPTPCHDAYMILYT